MKYIILAVIWSVYCFVHSYLISIKFTQFLQALLKKYYAFYRVFYILFSLITLIWVIRYTNQMDQDIIITYEMPWSVLRYILMAFSLIIFFRAFFFDYDSLAFFGIRQIQNFRKSSEGTSEIKKTGLLGIVRHPMYIALIIFLWCDIHTLGDIVVTIVLTIYVIIGTVLEERKLILEFGDSYKQYQQEVPMLLPVKLKKIIPLSH